MDPGECGLHFVVFYEHLPTPPFSPSLPPLLVLLFPSFSSSPFPPPPPPPQLNPNREGYYRANYPQETFGRLLEALKKGELKERDRIPIVEDTMALVGCYWGEQGEEGDEGEGKEGRRERGGEGWERVHYSLTCTSNRLDMKPTLFIVSTLGYS